MAEEGQDKRHAPTERRLRQATERGDVRRSADLPKAATIILAVTLALNVAASAGGHMEDLFASALAQAGDRAVIAAPGIAAGSWAGAALKQLTPLLVLIASLSTLSAMVSGGWIFSLEKLLPDLSKLLPTHGLGEIFSAPGYTETLKSLLKFIVIGGTAAILVWAKFPEFAALAGLPITPAAPGGSAMLSLCLGILTGICVAVVAVAGVDFGLQYWLHRQKLRMTDNEMRDEMKEAVGNPHVRQRQRAMARRMARTRQMRRVPEASVIITNPTHFAVAIRYRRGTDAAPLLLAKGVGLLAQQIISTARGLGIPIVETPPLARAIYQHVEPDEPIPVALYRACAEVLAYVWKMQQWRAMGGQRPTPPRPAKIEIAAKQTRQD
jgi:flagellar biosynthetic protein FlhB